jgi:UDPglucose 6-dehydrogenase
MTLRPWKKQERVPNITYSSDLYEAAEGADAVIVTEWNEFRQVDWARLRAGVERPLIVDGRNILDATEVTGRGFHYVSVGRPSCDAGAPPFCG